MTLFKKSVFPLLVLMHLLLRFSYSDGLFANLADNSQLFPAYHQEIEENQSNSYLGFNGESIRPLLRLNEESEVHPILSMVDGGNE